MSTPTMADFWIIEPGSLCYARPWAVPGLPKSVHQSLPENVQEQRINSQPFDLNVNIWLDRRSKGKLCDMPVCDGLHFVVSPKLHDVLKPFFGTSVRSREIEIRSAAKGNVTYHLLAIEEGSGPSDLARGHALFFTSWMQSRFHNKQVDIVDAYGIFFDVSTWNGADIFRMGPLGNQMIVTGRVADAISDSELVGVDVMRLDRYRYDEWQEYLSTGKKPY
ncbi:MAG: hypothetical protein LAT64_10710 [Phycisphaerales bacterium]|nr:hypothetical protein [Planctomycetota bacterium]MCH8509222.1 hypothetical protein [Phycisphaerales bacterium]